MRYLLLSFFIIISIFFVACEEEDVKPFEGTWSGTYTGDDSGTWEATVKYSSDDGVGIVTGTVTPSSGQEGNTISGALGSDGTITAAIGTTDGGGEWLGKFEKNDASGTWKGIDDSSGSPVTITGTWTGKKN